MRCRSFEQIEIKSVIMETICNNSKLVRLLTPDEITIDEEYDPTETLPFKKVMPFDLIPSILTEKGRYMSYEISFYRDKDNPTFKDMNITFDILTHRDLAMYKDEMAYPDRKGKYSYWCDWVAAEIDEMFCGEGVDLGIGVGKFKVASRETYFLSYARDIPFVGITLTLKVKDFTAGDKYGK